MTLRKREHPFSGRLSDEEQSMFTQLADREGMTKIQLLRVWIRREWQKYFGEKEGEK